MQCGFPLSHSGFPGQLASACTRDGKKWHGLRRLVGRCVNRASVEVVILFVGLALFRVVTCSNTACATNTES